MLLFLVEEQVFTFFHDFKEVNIDLGLDVYRSIQSLSIGDEYVIRGGAFGDCTVRRVAYEFADGYCIVGDRVYKVLPNGDVDFDFQFFTRYSVHFGSGGETFTKSVYNLANTPFSLYEYLIDMFCEVILLDHYDDERYYITDLAMDCWMDPVSQDCVEDSRVILESNWMCESIKPYAFAIYSEEDFGLLASVRGEPLRKFESIEYVQGYVEGKHRSTDNCEEITEIYISGSVLSDFSHLVGQSIQYEADDGSITCGVVERVYVGDIWNEMMITDDGIYLDVCADIDDNVAIVGLLELFGHGWTDELVSIVIECEMFEDHPVYLLNGFVLCGGWVFPVHPEGHLDYDHKRLSECIFDYEDCEGGE